MCPAVYMPVRSSLLLAVPEVPGGLYEAGLGRIEARPHSTYATEGLTGLGYN